jgi:hypothetical protein
MFWRFHPYKGTQEARGAPGILERPLAVCPQAIAKGRSNLFWDLTDNLRFTDRPTGDRGNA